MGKGKTSIGAVVIGRNEGDRLVQCLASLQRIVGRIIYVDSGSSDGSIAAAQKAGATIVELDTAYPFTAARARTAGFLVLQKVDDMPDYVQFVDGDCRMQLGWVEAAQAALDDDETLGIVTGWRSEMNRAHSIYNALCDLNGTDLLVKF